MAVFPKKKSENYTNSGMMSESPPVIFGFFSMLNYGKRSLESNFPFVFDTEKIVLTTRKN